MKIFLDTANIKEIKEANALGVIDGVTTNPSLIAKEGRNFIEVVKEICAIVASVRNPTHVLESALAGADIVTIPYGVLMSLVKHPLTDIGIERFLKDWQNVSKK